MGRLTAWLRRFHVAITVAAAVLCVCVIAASGWELQANGAPAPSRTGPATAHGSSLTAAGTPTIDASATPTPGTSPTPTSTPVPTAGPAPTAPPSPGGLSLRVSGNQLVNAAGQPITLHGVNRSGTEYACIQGWGIFDGPSDAASVAAIAAWHANSARLLLNEDCWLGINGVSSQYGGAAYRSAIGSYVHLLHQYGLYAEISLVWVAPGSQQATDQPPMPDADHSAAAWQSIAAYFKNDHAVMFGLYGEPHDIDWPCWLNGGGSCSIGYTAVGMQTLINVIRGTGATQPITVSCIDWANNCGSWLSYQPNDPLHQLVAEWHEYGLQTCDTAACWNSQELPLAQRVPLLAGEFGESYDASDCGASFVNTLLPWMSSHGLSYQAWTWDTWGTCDSLIAGYNGTPYSAYGQAVKSTYASS